ncbi:MAG: IS982 family transposase [Chloroflexi bacterium]|nr:IS982 family transposase [Chloroflexota bacterium]
MSVVELFCQVDDFWQQHGPLWRQGQLGRGTRRRQRDRSLCESEIMTILILFHQSHYRTFKAFYLEHVCVYLRGEFPGLVSYTRFVDFIPTVLLPLCGYLKHCFGDCTGISFIDATVLAVCDNHRIPQHRVFAGLAQRGKTSMGWFYGFKLHLVFNDRGELLNMALTPGNVDDRTPVPDLVQELFGKLFADKGYLSQALFEQLRDAFSLELITKLKKNMKNRLLPLADKLLLRKRAIVETIIDQLKNISQIEHTRHRSFLNFMVNLVCGLIAYCLQPKKPSLGLETILRLEAA